MSIEFWDQAERWIVVVDHTKFSVVASARVCSLEAFHFLITDSGTFE